MKLDLDFVRKQFPALNGDMTFFDNAGGSQTLNTVADRIHEYLLNTNVQLGASYETSQISGKRVEQATEFISELINAPHSSEIIFGSSTTLLLKLLSISMVKTFKPGDEVIVTDCDHEANIGAWLNMEEKGIKVKFWKTNTKTLNLEIEDLKKLLTPKTKLVALTMASNILGSINPIKEITEIVHAAGAKICVDAVAYAPHRLIDVQDLDVDFYAFSLYKVYGPHYAMLYGKKELLLELPAINHYFIGNEETAYKFQPGNANFELSYGYIGYKDYLESLAEKHFPDQKFSNFREKAKAVNELMADHEEVLAKRLLDYLNSKSNVKIIGKTSFLKTDRVPTISFIVNDRNSSEIVEKVDPHKIGIRFGDFYARRLIESLDLAKVDGVIRVSMVHYNTIEEVERLIQIFETIF